MLSVHSLLPARPSVRPTARAGPRMEAAAKPLIVVGSVNADLVLKVDRIPLPGETLGASSLDLFPGGKGANQAAAAAKLGFPTYFLGQTGTDANAVTLKLALSDCGVRLDHLKAVPGASGTAIILLQESGENSIIIVGGANQAVWDLQAEQQQLIRDAGAVLLQREIPEAVNLQVAQSAAAAGVPVFLDAGGVEAPLDPQLLPHLAVLSPNETELARLTGMPIDTEADVTRAAKALQAQGVDAVLVKLGSDGSLLIPGKGQPPVRQQCIRAKAVVDTTGAGDCFTAAFAVGVLEGRPYADAMRFASAAASICVQRAGAMPSLPLRTEVDSLLAAVV